MSDKIKRIVNEVQRRTNRISVGFNNKLPMGFGRRKALAEILKKDRIRKAKNKSEAMKNKGKRQ